MPKGTPIVKTKNHVCLQHTLKIPYIQFFLVKISKYTYNFNDKKITSDSMYTYKLH